MAEENMEQEEKPRSPFLWIGIIIALMALILILSFWQPEQKKPTDILLATAPAEFPLTTWFAIVAAILLLRTGVELYYIWVHKEKGNIWIGLDMLCIGLVLLSVIISFLYIDNPEEWWNNIWAEKCPGKFLLITLGLTLILWFILPGTGSITLKLGKPFCIIVSLGLMVILIFTATGGELKENDQLIWQKWFEEEKPSPDLTLKPASWSATLPMNDKIDTGLIVRNYGSFLITANKNFYLVQGDGKWGPEHLVLVCGPVKNRQMTYSMGGGIWVKAKYPNTKVEIKTL